MPRPKAASRFSTSNRTQDNKVKLRLAHLEESLELAHLEIEKACLGAELVISQGDINLRKVALLYFFLRFFPFSNETHMPALGVGIIYLIAHYRAVPPFEANVKTLQKQTEFYLHNPRFQDPTARENARETLLKEVQQCKQALKQVEKDYSRLKVWYTCVIPAPLMIPLLMMLLLIEVPSGFMVRYLTLLAYLLIVPIGSNKIFGKLLRADDFPTNAMVRQRLSEAHGTVSAFMDKLFEGLPYKLFNHYRDGINCYKEFEEIEYSLFKPITLSLNLGFHKYEPRIVARAISHILKMSGLAVCLHGKENSHITIFGIANQENYDKSTTNADKFKTLLIQTIEVLQVIKKRRSKIEDFVNFLSRETQGEWEWDKTVLQSAEIALNIFCKGKLNENNESFLKEIETKNPGLFDFLLDNEGYQLQFKDADKIKRFFPESCEPPRIQAPSPIAVLSPVGENTQPPQPRRPIHPENSSKETKKEALKRAPSVGVENSAKNLVLTPQNEAKSEKGDISCYYRNTKLQLFFPAIELQAMRSKFDNKVADKVEEVIKNGEWISSGSLGKSGKKSAFFDDRLVVRIKPLGKIAGSQRPCFISAVPTGSIPEGGSVNMQYMGNSHK